ncbi:unnamed protein product [Orchesella dallaii]|uniref:Uncharacterized protein n=1 Tax=Orchesella dallaii TaxID=48710 RepID=A0ABP1QLU3_9HEXA
MKTSTATYFAGAIFTTALFATFTSGIIGANAFSHSRSKRYLGSGTNPNNIGFTLGNQQLFPVNSGENDGWGNPIPTQQQLPTQNYQQPNNYGSQLNSFGGGNYQQTVDANNYGGTHQNNVGVGGIQNFAGARGEAQIQRILADARNSGGSHQTNAGIGGILAF